MKVHVRITRSLLSEIHHDLSRPHPFALERVAFLSCKPADLDNGLLMLVAGLHPIADSDYEDDRSVGAMLGSGAFRKALQYVYNNPVAMFHVHRHEHRGKPMNSYQDQKSSTQFVPDFWKVRSNFPHGTILLSHNSMSGLIWVPNHSRPLPITRFTVVGIPTQEVYE